MPPQDRDVSTQRSNHFGGTTKVPYAILNNLIGVYSFQQATPKQICAFKMKFLLPQPLEENFWCTFC